MKIFNRYEDFASEFVRTAMEDGSVSLIVNWKDCLGVVQILNTYTINGESVVITKANAIAGESDLEEVKETDGNMLITLFDNGELIYEKTLPNESAYVDDITYYVETDAKDYIVPSRAKVIEFRIG